MIPLYYPIISCFLRKCLIPKLHLLSNIKYQINMYSDLVSREDFASDFSLREAQFQVLSGCFLHVDMRFGGRDQIAIHV